MAIEDIFRALEEQAEAECADILRNAREQAEAILGEARMEADRIKGAKVETAEAAARQRTAQTLNSARLQNRKELAGVRDRAIERAFGDAEKRLAALRSTTGYGSTFDALAKEAVEAVSSYGECTLLVRSDDADKADSFAAAHGCGVETGLEASGGVAVLTAGGRIVVRNTFEDRLAKVRRSAQSHVAEMLFE